MKDGSERSGDSSHDISIEPACLRLARLANIDISVSDHSLLNFGPTRGESLRGSSDSNGGSSSLAIDSSLQRRGSERDADTVDSEYSVASSVEDAGRAAARSVSFGGDDNSSSGNRGDDDGRSAADERLAYIRGGDGGDSVGPDSVVSGDGPPAPISSPPDSVANGEGEDDGDEETTALASIHRSSIARGARAPSAISLSVENEARTRSDAVDDRVFEEEEAPPLRIERSKVSFGEARNIRTNSIQMTHSGLVGSTPALATAVAAADFDSESEVDDSRHSGPSNVNNMAAAGRAVRDSTRFSYKPSPKHHRHPAPAPAPEKLKQKGVLKNSGRAGPVNGSSNRTKNRLTAVSAMYDLDSDGVLDEVEQAMRDRDVDGDGQLDAAEVYKIVQEQLKSEADVHLYRKVAAGLLCLVAILAVSNFGTSMASAILAKDTRADPESGTIQNKKSGEVMGLQGVTYEWELAQLGPDEFEERRLLVDSEMLDDPDHEDHRHRRLGRAQPNHCSCSKVAYDHGKMREEDLLRIMRQCDGANQVSIKRKWRNDIMEGYENVETEMICGPGYEVRRTGKKKTNRKKTRSRVVEENVQFVKKGRRNDRRDDKVLSFTCDDGECFGSGSRLQQGLGHPCDPFKELSGASECDEGLYCHDGTCTALSRMAGRDQVCDVDFGLDACAEGYRCVEERVMTGPRGDGRQVGSRTRVEVGVVRTGICSDIVMRGRDMEVCDAGAFGDRACDAGYICLGANGRELEGDGIGYCTRLVQRQGRSGLCDLSYGRDACDEGYYCRDAMLPRSDGGGAAAGAGLGGAAAGYVGAVVAGPSGTVVAGQGAGADVGAAARTRPRASGTGTCTRSVPAGGVCSDDYECGWGGACVGVRVGANTASGGTIVGSSGVISWGNGGGASTGYCS